MSAFSPAEYEQFIKGKLRADIASGFDYDVPVGPLFDFQAACVKWALKRGRAALFLDTGLGKTLCQCTWAQLVHCMNLPSSKARDGFIGLKDFRGEIIRSHQDAGFIYHSEVCIWKDPVVAMQRTKALGLLYKQLRKDSAMSRQGIADYLVVLRKGIRISKWLPHPVRGPSIAVYAEGAEPDAIDTRPRVTKRQAYERYEARIKGTPMADVRLAKHRSKHWVKKAKSKPQTPWSALFAGVRLPLNAEG